MEQNSAHLINESAQAVPEALEGFARLQGGVALIEGENILVRRDRVVSKENRAHLPVALISGGGSGHEPAHAGFVAEGMLTAAVAGEIFSSPSVDAVLQALRSVTADAGSLLIVKSYTGDRLNFGLAAEIARSEGLAVEMVVVCDDVALGDSDSHAGRRGLAGTVLVHKIAGALAEQGASLAEVAQMARKVAANVRTMGVGLSSLTVPGSTSGASFELASGQMELGLGIHGERGVQSADLVSCDELASILLEKILTDAKASGLPVDEGSVLLIGNAGGTSGLEMGIAARSLAAEAERRGVRLCRLWQGPVMTSLGMSGISASLLPVDEELLRLLDAPTNSLAWPGSPEAQDPHLFVVPGHGAVRPDRLGPDDARVKASIDAACRSLIEAEEELTRRDQIVGDGDLGTSLSRGAQAWLTQDVQGSASELLAELSHILRKEIGGTSGPLYAVALLRASEGLPQSGPVSDQQWSKALRAGVEAIMELGGAKPGDKTMIDALEPAARAADRGLSAALDAAKEGTRSSAASAALKGRASYLGERARGEEDPGAVAVTIWLEALTRVDSSAG